MKKKHKYQMTMSLNVLKHLGIKLYSNIPAVLSEVVANAWDADAEKVDIKIDKNKITVSDDGLGMTVQESNAKYLLVGYDRRSQKGEAITPKHKRRVMGRKGIGKLSLFSIAKTIEVHSMKDKEKHGFVMNADAIEKLLEAQDNQVYYPKEIPASKVALKSLGTKIVIKDLKKGIKYVRTALRKRIARRFSIIGANTNFSVSIDGKPISIEDRDYFHKVQYLWYFGKDGKKIY
ncbi:ATP-binding protein [Candidatus Omnitrophota bacterium]